LTKKIGNSVPVKDHDFSSLWSTLDYGMQAAEAELQDAIKELKRWNDEHIREDNLGERLRRSERVGG
jgi:hypothetical protein